MRGPAILWVVTCVALAQSPAFDAASIKRAASSRGLRIGPGTFTGTGTLHELVRDAYGMPDRLVFATQPWMMSASFAVTARAAEKAPQDQIRLMLRNLLEERFGLKVHRESREMRYFVLVRAKNAAPLRTLEPDEQHQSNLRDGVLRLQHDGACEAHVPVFRSSRA